VHVVALFGPTGVGKTAVALALAELLRERGEDPVAISADALQVYRGLETLTGGLATVRPRAVHLADVREEPGRGGRRVVHEGGGAHSADIGRTPAREDPWPE